MALGITLALALPLGLIFATAFVLIGRWTDRKGWTRFRGSGKRSAEVVLNGWNIVDLAERQAAAEYLKVGHVEADHDGEPPLPESPVDEFQAEASQAEASQAAVSQAEAPQAEAPQAEASQAEASQAEASRAEASQSEMLQFETPEVEAPQAEEWYIEHGQTGLSGSNEAQSGEERSDQPSDESKPAEPPFIQESYSLSHRLHKDNQSERFPGIEDGRMEIRPLTGTALEIASLTRWLSDERVLTFYGGRDKQLDTAAVCQNYVVDMPEQQSPCLVLFDGAPIGYLEFGLLDEAWRKLTDYEGPTRVFGLKLFIGEPEKWGTGIGARVVRMIVAYLFELDYAEAVVVEPTVDNERAIRCFAKRGFRQEKLLPKRALHEGVPKDCWLMDVTPKRIEPLEWYFHVTLPKMGFGDSD